MALSLAIMASCSSDNEIAEAEKRLEKRVTGKELITFDPDFRFLFQQGAVGLPAIFRVWVNHPERTSVIRFWNEWVVSVLQMGISDAYNAMFPAEIRANPGKVTQRLFDEGWLIEIEDGIVEQCVIFNPVKAYDSVKGAGSWPSDLPLERIRNPRTWKTR